MKWEGELSSKTEEAVRAAKLIAATQKVQALWEEHARLILIPYPFLSLRHYY